ncbi:MAG: hypothetical protein ABIE74_05715 [Pseudomonadota bacterium]
MKKIVLLLVLLYSSISMACEIKTYKVFYTPLEMQFFVPPSREYLIEHSFAFDLASSKLTCLFDMLSKQKGSKAKDNDYTGFRIIIQDKKNKKELIITTDKVIFSGNKVYKINVKIVDEILDELNNEMKRIKNKKK